MRIGRRLLGLSMRARDGISRWTASIVERLLSRSFVWLYNLRCKLVRLDQAFEKGGPAGLLVRTYIARPHPEPQNG